MAVIWFFSTIPPSSWKPLPHGAITGFILNMSWSTLYGTSKINYLVLIWGQAFWSLEKSWACKVEEIHFQKKKISSATVQLSLGEDMEPTSHCPQCEIPSPLKKYGSFSCIWLTLETIVVVSELPGTCCSEIGAWFCLKRWHGKGSPAIVIRSWSTIQGQPVSLSKNQQSCQLYRGWFKKATREIAWNPREIRVKYQVYPWNTKFTRESAWNQDPWNVTCFLKSVCFIMPQILRFPMDYKIHSSWKKNISKSVGGCWCDVF